MTVEAGFEAPLPADSNQWVLHTDARCRDVLRAQLAERTRQRDVWQKRAAVLAKMLSHYRLGTHPTEKTLRELDESRAALERLRQGGNDGR